MRLIDADSFIKFMTALEEHGAENISFDDLRRLMDKQATAYDVDKVAEQLEKMRDTVIQNITLNSQSYDIENEIESERKFYTEIIEMVKAGGTDE